MRRKHNFIIFLIILLLPLIHLFDNHLIGRSPYPSPENSLKITPLSDEFALTVHIGDPFSAPYTSFEFNPDDFVLIAGAVRNLALGGPPNITVALWLVSAQTNTIETHITNLTSISFSIGTNKTFKQLNLDDDVNWSINNFDAGTYRVMAQVWVDDVKYEQTVSGKTIVIRQLRLADFNITSKYMDTFYGFIYNITNTGNREAVQNQFYSKSVVQVNPEGFLLFSVEFCDMSRFKVCYISIKFILICSRNFGIADFVNAAGIIGNQIGIQETLERGVIYSCF